MKKNFSDLKQISSLLLVPVLLFFCFSCSKEKRIIEIQSSLAYQTLGDAVVDSSVIAYGEILEKGQAMAPDFFAAFSSEVSAENYCRKVILRVTKGLKNCQTGDIITYWEPGGGETPEGAIYEYTSFLKAETGERALLFLDENGVSFSLGVLVEDENQNIHVPDDYMIETARTPPETEGQYSVIEIPMEEYMEKVEKVIQAQAESK